MVLVIIIVATDLIELRETPDVVEFLLSIVARVRQNEFLQVCIVSWSHTSTALERALHSVNEINVDRVGWVLVEH